MAIEGAMRHRAAKKGDAAELDRVERVQINGLPGFVVHTHNGIETVAIDIEGDRIVAVYSVRNPEKLRHVS